MTEEKQNQLNSELMAKVEGLEIAYLELIKTISEKEIRAEIAEGIRKKSKKYSKMTSTFQTQIFQFLVSIADKVHKKS